MAKCPPSKHSTYPRPSKFKVNAAAEMCAEPRLLRCSDELVHHPVTTPNSMRAGKSRGTKGVEDPDEVSMVKHSE